MKFQFPNEFSQMVFESKYSGENKTIEEVFDYGVNRVKRALDESSGNVPLFSGAVSDNLRDMLYNGRFVFGGRILAAFGRPSRKLSLYNCSTLPIMTDSLTGDRSIGDTISKVMRLSSRGQGIGISFGALRPRGSKVNSAAYTSTGAVSFMGLIDKIGDTLIQDGDDKNPARRLALLFTLPVWHPDVIEFIKVKQEVGKITNANISIEITEAFIEACENDTDWNLEFEGQVFKTMPARELMRMIAESNMIAAEPGVVFMENAKAVALCHKLGFPIVGMNACLSENTTVLTPKGVRKLSEVNVGDRIWSKEGWTTIVKKWITGNKPVFKYHTSEGEFLATADHKVFCEGKRIDIGSAIAVDSVRMPDNIGPFSGKVVDFQGALVTRVEELGEEVVWDITVDNKSHSFWSGGLDVSNCTEAILDYAGVCNLGSLNLSTYVSNEHQDWDLNVNWKQLSEDVYTAVAALDAVITIEFDENRVPISEQYESQYNLRRIGLGVMGLADMVALLGAEYGDDDSLEIVDTVMRFIANESYKASANLAYMYGPCPAVEKAPIQDILDNEFVKRLDQDTRQLIAANGLRNAAILSVAPTGSISNIAGCSSGAEPLYRKRYTRYTRLRGDWESIDYAHPVYAKWPNAKWVEANEVTPERKLNMIATVQRWVDQSVSNTGNFTADTKVEDIEEYFIKAFRSGVKGLTVYVENDQTLQTRGAVLTDKVAKEEPEEEKFVPEFTDLYVGVACRIDLETGEVHCDD